MAFEMNEYQVSDDSDIDSNIEIEIEDDTPEEDKGRQPMPKPIVEELERDELDEYDEKAQQRLKQLRKVWHDERREKESAQREHQEAVALARNLLEENQRLNSVLSSGEQEYVTTAQKAAALELEKAKRKYKEAYDLGDSDALVDAQEELNLANIKMLNVHNMRTGTLQTPQHTVKQVQEQLERPVQEAQVPSPSQRALEWQERNPWYNTNREMRALALGVHYSLVKEQGIQVDSDEYYNAIDKTMRLRFSDYFNQDEKSKGRPQSIVAPSSRSTAPNKIRLSKSQVQLAKKLGLSPEQYAKAALKLENRHG
jgi:hypothetical protein